MDCTDPRAAFCARLKAAREARGLSLEAIAASTKISAALFRGLERGDFSRWPKGLYRRSYLRDYLRLVGLPPDDLVREFVRLYPDPDDPAAAPEPGVRVDSSDAPVALTLGSDPALRRARARTQIAAAALDAGLVLLTAFVIVVGNQADPAASIATVALTYYGVATAFFGRSPGTRWLDGRRLAAWKRSGAAEPPEAPFSERVRDLLADGARTRLGPGLTRVAWNAVLLRIWFFR